MPNLSLYLRVLRPLRPFALSLLLLSAVVQAGAQTGYPMVTSVFPLCIQRGKTTEITVTGQQNFAGAYGALFEGKGISAEVVQPNPAPTKGSAQNTVTLKVTTVPDAPLGAQEFRVATPRGLSTIGMLVV